ncbi:uncharacterized protein RAG0_17549 [Rhynchosporium agropyri]|uniref:Uncharacterized protein n=2 Tax=Rhynchosporium TaxID=38037 RepID=A0A1E1MUY4_RHYSE|nr:uncharacterized protein RAG0_17549 [Rhynchosporium agropyri]CZT52869.1 uncharacterized protein RSE6_14264 [Rhynchosporium secalis]
MLRDTRTLLEYIQQLENKLEYLEQHHQQCSIHKQSLPLRLGNESEISSTELNGTGLSIISFIPEPAESRQAQQVPKWQKTAAQVVDDIPSADDWDVRRKEVNLFTVEENYFAIAAISGGIRPSRSLCPMPTEPGLGPIDLARAYARMTKTSEGNAAFTCRLHYFHELVFVSLCAVLEASGYPPEEINETMRIYVSDTEDINLKRLRRGALWANSAIRRLAEAGWGDRATELFLLCGCSAAKYAAFGENRKKSLPFFVDHLKQPRYISVSKKSGASPSGKQDLLPATSCERISYSIPAFIKVWFGDWFGISEICQHLGYGDECDSEPIAELCQQYAALSRCVTAAGKESLRKRKADTSQFSNRKNKLARICELDTEFLEHSLTTSPRSAYRQTDIARPAISLRNQQNLPDSRQQVEAPPLDDSMAFQNPPCNHHSSSSIVNQTPDGNKGSTPVPSPVSITEGRRHGTSSHVESVCDYNLPAQRSEDNEGESDFSNICSLPSVPTGEGFEDTELMSSFQRVERLGHREAGNIDHADSITIATVNPNLVPQAPNFETAECLPGPSTWTEFPPDPFQEHMDPFTVFQDLHVLFPGLMDVSGCS